MSGIGPAWATRFCGMEVPADVAAASTENLTDASIEDLVAAHLAINDSYFGAIDKTLAGFVILDDEADDYTLFDLRGGGQVWVQSHETREVELRFASLADWQADAAGGEQPTPSHARRSHPRSSPRPGSRRRRRRSQPRGSRRTSLRPNRNLPRRPRRRPDQSRRSSQSRRPG